MPESARLEGRGAAGGMAAVAADSLLAPTAALCTCASAVPEQGLQLDIAARYAPASTQTSQRQDAAPARYATPGRLRALTLQLRQRRVRLSPLQLPARVRRSLAADRSPAKCRIPTPDSAGSWHPSQ